MYEKTKRKTKGWTRKERKNKDLKKKAEIILNIEWKTGRLDVKRKEKSKD